MNTAVHIPLCSTNVGVSRTDEIHLLKNDCVPQGEARWNKKVKCGVQATVLLEWGIAVNISKSTVQAARRIKNFRPVQLFGAPIQWVGTARCLLVSLDMQPA
jgi:hypothetical protein